MAGKSGLVPVKRFVVRDGKTFQTTVYIKPKHGSSVDPSKHVQVPTWKFSTADDFQNEVARINKIADRSERKILKEQLLEHVEKTMGVKYTKVPDNEPNAFARNTMRAFSEAKKHLNANPGQKTTPSQQKPAQQASAPSNTPTPNKGGITVTKQPGKDYIMPKDDSKKLAREFRDKHGMDKMKEIMKANGITWNEVPDDGPNNMRALRKLASFMRKGGELGEGNSNQPQLVLNNPNQPLQPEPKSKYEKDSIQHDYELAKAKHKLIGLATGVMPVDDKTAEYLENLVKSGQFGVLDGEKNGYGLPKKLDEALTNFVNRANKEFDSNNNLTKEFSKYDLTRYHLFGAFDRINKTKEYEDYKKAIEDIKAKWGELNPVSHGVDELQATAKTVEAFEKLDSKWTTTTGKTLLTKLEKKLRDSEKLSDAEVNKLWDELDIDSIIYRDKGASMSSLENMINTSCIITNRSGYIGSELKRKFGGSLADVRLGLATGRYTKKDIFKSIADSTKEINDVYGTTQGSMANLMVSAWNANSLLGKLVKDAKNKKVEFNSSFVVKKTSEMLADMAPLNTPEASYIAFNIRFLNRMEDMRYSLNVKLPDKIEPLSMEDWSDSRTLESKVKIHVGAMRKSTDKAKQKYIADQKKKGDTNYSGALKDGTDPETLTYPNADDIKNVIKTTLMTVPDDEAKKVEAKVHQTHDKKGHGSFETKVHGVYRVKRIASEEKFKKINDDINNTGFYYHGTSFDTAQKILGLTGGFKVFTAKDSANIKAGSMLGYGIYLASESSKSMQYVGNGFRSGNRGVLFMCKASLGKVVETSLRGCNANQPIMAKDTTDTVFMDRPHVVNPEWAVKRAEQAVPRLWIDAERVRK